MITCNSKLKIQASCFDTNLKIEDVTISSPGLDAGLRKGGAKDVRWS